MDRHTKLTKIDNSSTHELGSLLDTYGPDILSKLIGKVYIFQYKYSCNGMFKANITRGRPIHHLNKVNGKLKYKYKNTKLREILCDEFSAIPSNRDNKLVSAVNKIKKAYLKHISNRSLYATLIQKYIRGFLTRKAYFDAKNMIDEGLNFLEDVITCDTLKDPVVIFTDWDIGNKFIYDFQTIENFLKIKKEPVYWYTSTTSETQYIYRYIYEVDIFGNKLFKSPMTRKEFTINDIVPVKEKLWYRVGSALQLKMS